MPTTLPKPAKGEDVVKDWAKHKPVKPEYDVAIIGGGSAGFAAARTVAGFAAKAILIEGGEKIGGLCILRGCMPSKTLLESAHRWHAIKHAGEFGLNVKPLGVDMKFIQARKKKFLEEFAAWRHHQLAGGKFTFLQGYATFLDPQTLLINHKTGKQELVTASAFIIATGSVITRVPVPGLWETGCWTSDDALDAETIPKRLAVLGGGVIAVELGQFFSRVGSKTTMLQRSDHIVRSYDPEVSAELENAFAAEKLAVRTGVKLIEVSKTSKGKKVTFECGGKREELVVDEILYAMGRAPALSGLKLENAGVKLADGKMQVDGHMAASVPHIFGAGDAVGPHEVVHIGILQGEIAARNAVRLVRSEKGEPESIDYRLKTLVTFTEPEIASVGLTEVEATEQGIEHYCASYPFKDHGKSMVGGHNFGFVKILAEKTRGEIIGAEIIGPDASNLIHELIAVMRYKGTAQELAMMPHYHPTLAEIITYPAEELAEKILAGNVPEQAQKHF
jgi:pyruvate/2-oxoglutarate dehydrogenase complex dihydrolipoamide dehydrogenase (E3) component